MNVIDQAAALGFPTLTEAGISVDPAAVRMLGRRSDAVAVALADGILEVVVDAIPTAALIRAMETVSGCEVAVTVTEPRLLSQLADRAHAENNHTSTTTDVLAQAGDDVDRIALIVGQPPLLWGAAGMRVGDGPALNPTDIADMRSFLGAGDDDRSLTFTWAGRQWAATASRSNGQETWTLVRRERAAARLDQLGLPAAAGQLCERDSGLVLVASPAGGGRTFTAIAMAEQILNTRAATIVVASADDRPAALRRGLLVHRRLGVDVDDVAEVAYDAMRERVDVIVVDAAHYSEADVAALASAAAAGILVIATVGADQTGTALSMLTMHVRAEQRPGVLAALAAVCVGGVNQVLLGDVDGGKVVAAEVWAPTPAHRANIRSGAFHTGFSSGLRTAAAALVAAGRVDPEATRFRGSAFAGLGSGADGAHEEVPAGWSADSPDDETPAGVEQQPRRSGAAANGSDQRSSARAPQPETLQVERTQGGRAQAGRTQAETARAETARATRPILGIGRSRAARRTPTPGIDDRIET